MTDKSNLILETLAIMNTQLREINEFLDALNYNQAQTDVKVTDIKLFLMNNGEQQ